MVKSMAQRNVPVPAFVINISFDTTASFPKLVFKPTRWIKNDEAEEIKELFGSEECDNLVGRNDQPISASAGIAQPAPVPMAAAPAAPVRPQANAQFVPATPAVDMPVQTMPPAGMPQHTTQALAEQPRRRGRPPKAEGAAPVAAAPQSAQAASVVQPAVVAAASVPATSMDMDNLLDAVMARK